MVYSSRSFTARRRKRKVPIVQILGLSNEVTNTPQLEELVKYVTPNIVAGISELNLMSDQVTTFQQQNLLSNGLGKEIIMEPKVIPGIYEHNKENKYLLPGIAGHSETEERTVVYVTLYETPGPSADASPDTWVGLNVRGARQALPAWHPEL